MNLLPIFFIGVFILPCASLPTSDLSLLNGTENECAIYGKEKKCTPGHELIDCGNSQLMRCSPCKKDLYQCDYTTPEFRAQCQRPSCPELGKETTVNLTIFKNGTCHLSCICNEANGYTGKSGSNCLKHSVCGLDKELKYGKCVACSPGFHNPNTDYGPCVAYETHPSTSSPITKSTSASSTPSDQGSGLSNKIWIIVICLIVVVVAALILGWWCCRGNTNMACCNSTAIQDSPRGQQDVEARENPPPYSPLLNGGLFSGTGGHHPNGIASAPRNGISSSRPARIPATGANGIPGSPGTSPGASPNGIPSTPGSQIPGASPNGIPSTPGNQIPGASPNGIPSTPGSQSPGASPNGIPRTPGNQTPGAPLNEIPDIRPNGIDESGDSTSNGSHSSISGRPAPTGTTHPSTRSLASCPSPLNSQDSTFDHFHLSEPLTSDSTSLNLPRPQDPEQTGRKMPITSQAIDTGSGDINVQAGDDDKDNEESQGLLSGLSCGLVELDNDRNLSHVPHVC